MRRSLTEDEQSKVADAIVKHLESSNWKIEHATAGRAWNEPHAAEVPMWWSTYLFRSLLRQSTDGATAVLRSNTSRWPYLENLLETRIAEEGRRAPLNPGGAARMA
jgi:hypothetical protein